MPDNKELLNQGIEAARNGDKETARKLFEEVLENDDKNVKAWMLLYRVVDDITEKRICLTTILQLEPDNEKAREALEKLDAKSAQTKADEEVLPGITRRQLRLILSGVGGVVLLVIVVVVLIVSGNNARIAADQKGTADANAILTSTVVALLAEQTLLAAELTEEATNAAATLFAIASPTITLTPTRNVPTLPPEFTATPPPTADIPPTPLPYPQGVPGTIIAWSGLDIDNNGFLPIVALPLAAPGQSNRVGTSEGIQPVISPDGRRIIYTRYFATTFDFGLEAINPNGTQPEDLGQRWRAFQQILKSQMANFSADGNQIVFVGVPRDTNAPQVFLLNLTVQGGDPIIRLTQDDATYSYPAISPDGRQIVVVKNDKNSATPGEDLVLIDIASRTQRALTTDFTSFVESAPRWSLDGRQIVYSAAPVTDPENADIVIINSDGSGVPLLPVRSRGNDIFPVYSPDGRYIAFASNRSGDYQIFIYELAAGTLWQVTNSEGDSFPGGWTYN